MKVRAKGEVGKVAGYYNNRRIRGGEVFEISDEVKTGVKDQSRPSAFSDKWMEEVDAKAKTIKRVEAPRAAVPLSKANKVAEKHTVAEVEEPVKGPEADPAADQQPAGETGTGDQSVI